MMNAKSLEEKCAWMRARIEEREKTQERRGAEPIRTISLDKRKHDEAPVASRSFLPRIEPKPDEEAVRVTIAGPARDLPEEEASDHVHALVAYWLTLARKATHGD